MPAVIAGRRYQPGSIPGGGGAAFRPYAGATLWNSTLAALYPSGVPVHASSASFLSVARQNKNSSAPLRDYLGTDTTQSTMPLYLASNATPLQTVRVWSSWRFGNDSNTNGTFQVNQDVQVPIPTGVRVPGFSDYQVVIYNVDTGDEWSFWKCGTNLDESAQPGLGAGDVWQPYDVGGGVLRYTCQSAANYRPSGADGSAGTGGWITGNGRPSMTPKAWNQRGAKVPYGIGLVRPWEVAQGHIDHAIAYAFHGPSPEFTLPAQGSDGGNFGGVAGSDMPEGARIFLDPTFDLTLFPAGTARVVGQALKTYGAICIDNAGYPKVYLEASYSAGWTDVTPSMLSAAPLSSYRVVDWTAPQV